MTAIFSFDGTAESFPSLATSIDGTLKNDVLVIDNDKLKGAVKRTELERGFYLVNWNLNVLEDYIFTNTCCHSHSKHYFITYFYEAQFERIAPKEGKDLKCRRYHPCTTLYQNALDMTYVYKEGKKVNCVCIIFSETWLVEQAQAEMSNSIIQSVFFTQPDAIYISTTSATEQILSSQLLKEFDKNPSWLSLKAYSYNLLNTFLNYTLPASSVASKPKPYMELVIEVEKKIHDSLTSTLPSTTQLADEFYIGSSTLKRQFKRFYGKNIYQYYLEQKMLLARDILQKGKSTVSEVANTLGYENVSHFIAIFKKHFNSSPSEVGKHKNEL